MANQYKNKVIYNGIVLIDLTQDTVVESVLAEGYTAHAADGAVIHGSIPDGDLLGYGLNTSSRVNVAQADYAVVQDYTGSQTGKAIAELAVLSE